jgi:Carboxypeptidase regulatory-like domain/TonB dependent receptor-like, beta-barrel
MLAKLSLVIPIKQGGFMFSTIKSALYRIPLALALVVWALSGSALSQGQDGSLRGEVKDSTGAIVSGAKVIAVNESTGVARETTSSSVGTYSFPNLLVGKYTVTVEASGFKKSVRKNVAILANQVSEAHAALEVGNIENTVEVTGSELVTTTSSQIGGSLTERGFDLPNPVLGGNPLNFAVLFPNTTTQAGGVAGMGGSVGGNRPRNNNFTIDGVDNNDVAVTGPLSPVIADSVAEFNLLTNQFSAEYGHSTAGQFNVITKSGTNELHGSAWYYGQNRNLNANDNLVNAAIKAGDIPGAPRYDFNRTGGSAGAPIIKNKLFFFGAYEYQTRGRAATGVTVLTPTSAGLSTLNSLAANSAVRAVLAQLPTASAATDTDTVNGQTIPVGPFQAFAPDFFTQHDFQTNVDATLGAHQLRGRFLYDRFRQPNVNPDLPLPQFTGNLAVDNRKVVFTDVWTLSPRLVNDFRTSYSRNVFGLTVPDAFSNFPNVAIDNLGLSFGPDGAAPQSGVQNVYQFLNNLSYLTGRHQLKGGVEFRHWIAPANFLPRARGEFGYSNLETLVNDLVPDGLNGALRGAGSGFFAGNQSAIYWFFQDDLKVTKNLTLNLGLRYEYTTNARDTNLQTLNAVSSAPGLFEFRKPETDKNNFAPRFGFAYAPSYEGGLMRALFGESGKSSIRGGFGIAYDVTFQNLPTLQLPPQLQTEQNPNLSCAGATRPSWCATGAGFLAGGGLLQVNVPPTTQAAARSAVQGIILDQRQPKTLSWSLSIQRELARNLSVEVRYLGTRGLNLPIQVRENSISVFERNPGLVLPTFFSPSQVPATMPATAPTRADFLNAQDLRFTSLGFDGGFLTSFRPIGNSIYHGGSVDVNRRLSQGFLLKGNWTWSHAIDDSTNELFTSRVNPRRPQYPFDIRNERGNSTIDKTHKFSVAWVYDLPKAPVSNAVAKKFLHGWQVNGVYLAETGQPITALSGQDANGDIDTAGDRAILNPNGVGLRGSGVNFVRRDPVTGATSIVTTNPGSALVVGYVAKDPNARFIVAEAGTISTLGRNTIRSPGLNNWNLSIFKNTNITETRYFQFRFEMFNAFNHRQRSLGLGTVQGFNGNALSTSYANVSSGLFLDDSQFSGGSRTIQYGLKFVF